MSHRSFLKHCLYNALERRDLNNRGTYDAVRVLILMLRREMKGQ
jgi:hypothetical protein